VIHSLWFSPHLLDDPKHKPYSWTLQEWTTLTNDQIYRDVKEQVLDTAGCFVDFVKGASEDKDNSENDDDELPAAPKVYQPPSATLDPKLSAGEVVEIVLEALRHLDNPMPLYGMDVLFVQRVTNQARRRPHSSWNYQQLEGIGIQSFVCSQGCHNHWQGWYSFDGKKAFLTALLKVGPSVKDVVAVNLILSNAGDEADAWMVDSVLIRPESMRRRRRK
jgi:hypothetical protein